VDGAELVIVRDASRGAGHTASAASHSGSVIASFSRSTGRHRFHPLRRLLVRRPASPGGARPQTSLQPLEHALRRAARSSRQPMPPPRQEITEFEFHISPTPSSSRPHHRGVGTDGTRSSGPLRLTRRPRSTWAQPPGDVGDDTVTPTANLVPEDPKTPSPALSDCAFGDDASLPTVRIGNRSLLDHEPSLRYVHLERGVIEVAGRPPPDPRRNRLVDAPVQPHRMTPALTAAGRGRRRRHGGPLQAWGSSRDLRICRAR
jgi:hypothetical protein